MSPLANLRMYNGPSLHARRSTPLAEQTLAIEPYAGICCGRGKRMHQLPAGEVVRVRIRLAGSLRQTSMSYRYCADHFPAKYVRLFMALELIFDACAKAGR